MARNMEAKCVNKTFDFLRNNSEYQTKLFQKKVYLKSNHGTFLLCHWLYKPFKQERQGFGHILSQVAQRSKPSKNVVEQIEEEEF